jgi:hypothetical protein
MNNQSLPTVKEQKQCFFLRKSLPLSLNGEILNFHSHLIVDPATKYQAKSTFASPFSLQRPLLLANGTWGVIAVLNEVQAR